MQAYPKVRVGSLSFIEYDLFCLFADFVILENNKYSSFIMHFILLFLEI